MDRLCENIIDIAKQEKEQKKISIACLHLNHGGIEMAVTSLANALSEAGYSVELLCTYRLCEPVYALNSQVTVTYLTDRRPNQREIAAAWSSRRFFDLVRELSHAFFTLLQKRATMIRAIRRVQDGVLLSTRHEYTLLLSRYGRPGVWKMAQLHQDHQFSRKRIRQMKTGYRNIDVLVLPTRQAADELQDILSSSLPVLSCVAIPHFLSYQREPHSVAKKKQVIAVGRLHPEKGFARMLKIWSRISPLHPDVMLKIVGDGDQRRQLEEESRKLKIQDTVLFTGMLPHDQVLDEMEQSLCYWMTSLEESFGFVLIEAFSCGIPVVAYDVRTGPREIVEDGVNGFLVPDGNEDKMVEKMHVLLSEEGTRQRLGRQAKQSALHYEKTAILQKWIQWMKG